jgi:hypothetical protein
VIGDDRPIAVEEDAWARNGHGSIIRTGPSWVNAITSAAATCILHSIRSHAYDLLLVSVCMGALKTCCIRTSAQRDWHERPLRRRQPEGAAPGAPRAWPATQKNTTMLNSQHSRNIQPVPVGYLLIFSNVCQDSERMFDNLLIFR